MFDTSGIRRNEDGSIDTGHYIAAAKDRRSEAATRALKRFAKNAFDLAQKIFPESAPQRGCQ